MATPERYGSLKSHRTLPRYSAESRYSHESDDLSYGQVSDQVERIERRLSAKTDANGLTSWINDQAQVPSQHPLTPPTQAAEAALPNGVSTPQESDRPPPALRESPATPRLQRSPPTPDQTPPKRLQPNEPRNPRATPSSHMASSVTGSFMTAQEEFSAENLLAHRERARAPSPAPSTPTRAPVGLGLGLETPNGHRTPRMPSPRIAGESLADAWDGAEEGVEADPFLASESMAVQEIDTRKLQPRTPEDFQASLERMSRDRDASVWAAERLMADDRPDSLGSDFLDLASKRFSDVSSTPSQVVQALVISTPRRKRQRLRHAGKNESLRTASSPLESNRSSMASSEAKHRPLHRTPKVDWGKRISQNSDSGISMGSGPKQVAPPELMGRMSSLRRSSAKERALARRASDLAREAEATRPVTAPETTNQVPVKEPDRRSNSLVVNDARRHRGRRTIDYPPVIPPRGSSLSATTSRDNSRTTSLTAVKNSPQSQVQQLAPATQKMPQESPTKAVQLSPRVNRYSVHLTPEIVVDETPDERHDDGGNSEDRYSARRRSVITTPFSGVSVLSSTPGPIEVNEATAINIFPHNNTSVLVVRQFGGDDVRRSDFSRNVGSQLDEVHGRARLMPPKSYSPLRNPRPAPAPAVIIRPATPAGEGAAAPDVRRSPKPAPLPSRIATVRRALSARRHSETLIAPFTRPLVARSQVGSKKVSPLWRPRPFWNDIEDPDTEADDPNHFVRNTLGLPQRKFIPGPGSLSRRIGSLRRRKQIQATGADIDDVETRVGILSRLRGSSHVKPFASLAEAIEKLRARRTEQKLEKQRDRIRRHIGPVLLPADARHF